MKVAIHQPDFFPWFGFFKKLARAEVWIVLDHTSNNPRDAAFWGRRVKILVNGQATWLSIPLCKPSKSGLIGIPIRDMAISATDPAAMHKVAKTLHMSYAAAPFYKEFKHLHETYCEDSSPMLVPRNMQFITQVMSLLELKTKIVCSSSLSPQGSSTQLLVDLLTKEDATTYVCGTGAGGYQDDELLKSKGFHLEFNTFEHPRYAQLRTAEFVPGLSILDMLFMVGRDATKTLLNA